jgi:hypothetical protein
MLHLESGCIAGRVLFHPPEHRLIREDVIARSERGQILSGLRVCIFRSPIIKKIERIDHLWVCMCLSVCFEGRKKAKVGESSGSQGVVIL